MTVHFKEDWNQQNRAQSGQAIAARKIRAATRLQQHPRGQKRGDSEILVLLLVGELPFVYNVYRPINWSWQQQSAFRISVCALPHKPTKTAKRDVLVLECPFGIESSSGIESPEVFPDLDHLVNSSHAGQMRIVARTNQRMATSQLVPASGG